MYVFFSWEHAVKRLLYELYVNFEGFYEFLAVD